MFGRKKKDLRDGMLSTRAPEPSPEPVHEAPRAQAPTPKLQATSAPAQRRFIWSEGVQVKGFAVLILLVLGYGLPIIAKTITYVFSGIVPLPGDPRYEWASYYYDHTVQFVLTLIAISFARRSIKADFGLHMPHGKSYAGWAILWSLLFGVLATAADYLPQIHMHLTPEGPYGLDPVNVTGWMTFAGLYSGPTEEILYRALMVTYAIFAIPGRVGISQYTMSAGGVVVAAVMALESLLAFVLHPLYIATILLFFGFAMSVLFAYWFEKSQSLFASVVGHNVAAATKYALIFWMVALWR